MPVPFNLTSLDMLFTAGQAARMVQREPSPACRRRGRSPHPENAAGRDGDLRGLADYIYNNIFLGYTTKQWGRRPEELSGSVTARVPVA